MNWFTQMVENDPNVITLFIVSGLMIVFGLGLHLFLNKNKRR